MSFLDAHTALEAIRCGRILLDGTALIAQRAPFWLLCIGHSLTAVQGMREYTSRGWLVSWLLCFLSAFAGGTISALLLQAPGTAAVSLLAKNQLGLIYTAVWWAFNYFPGGWVAQTYDALPPLRTAGKLCLSVLRASTVVHRVNAAVQLHPGVVAAPLVLGTLGGAGGRLTVDAFAHCAGYPRQGPSELARPGLSLRSAFLGALLHYALVHVTGVLTGQQGLGLVVTMYVVHSLAQDLTGQPCDYTAPLAQIFHKLTFIPEVPNHTAAAAPAARPRAARTPAAAAGRAPRAAPRTRTAAVAVSADAADSDSDGGPLRTARQPRSPRSRAPSNGGRHAHSSDAEVAALAEAILVRTTRRRTVGGRA